MKIILKFALISICATFCITNLSVASSEVNSAKEAKPRPYSFSNNFDATPIGEEIYYPISAPFCQIFTSKFNFWKMSTEIIKFSTFKLGPCNGVNFAKLSISSVIAQLKTITQASIAYKNGPSYFTMDINLSPLNREYVYIGPLKFFAQSIINISILEVLFDPFLSKKGVASAYFVPFDSHEDIYYIWNKGSPIYVLVPPDRKGYFVMTSYSTMVDPSMVKTNIVDKVSELDMPKGWTFETRILDKPLIVRTQPTKNFSHQVLFDQLQNFYHYVE